jgi:hypothetical protein
MLQGKYERIFMIGFIHRNANAVGAPASLLMIAGSNDCGIGRMRQDAAVMARARFAWQPASPSC